MTSPRKAGAPSRDFQANSPLLLMIWLKDATGGDELYELVEINQSGFRSTILPITSS
jgi:hypothetical protein